MNRLIKGKVVFFGFLSIVSAVGFSFFFTPVTDIGDGPAYIRYALQVAGHDIPENYFHRSPLYSHLIALLINRVEDDLLYRLIVSIQFVLNLITAFLIFRIGEYLFNRRVLATLTSALFFYNLSTIYYGYMILTESLAILLFIVAVYLFIKYLNTLEWTYVLKSGFVVALLFLARFNTLPLIPVFFFLIVYVSTGFVRQGGKRVFRVVFAYLFPIALLLNGYCLYNLHRYQEYRLLPSSGSSWVFRNAVIASLDGTEQVTPEYEPVLRYFLMAKRDYDKQDKSRHGSLLRYDKLGMIHELYSGYYIYSHAIQNVRTYLGLDQFVSESVLMRKLDPFYRQIRQQNRSTIFKLRWYSFLNNFRSSLGSSQQNRKDNLHRLPSGIIKGYKLIYLGVSLSTFILSLIMVIYLWVKKIKFNPVWFSLVILCYSFYAINFMFATVGDANRYNYLSEPLMIMLFIYNVSLFWKTWQKQSDNLKARQT